MSSEVKTSPLTASDPNALTFRTSNAHLLLTQTTVYTVQT